MLCSSDRKKSGRILLPAAYSRLPRACFSMAVEASKVSSSVTHVCLLPSKCNFLVTSWHDRPTSSHLLVYSQTKQMLCPSVQVTARSQAEFCFLRHIQDCPEHASVWLLKPPKCLAVSHMYVSWPLSTFFVTFLLYCC